MFVDPDDCTRFYVCSSQLRSCPEGTAFSTRSGSCQRDVPECAAVNPPTTTTTTRRPVERCELHGPTQARRPVKPAVIVDDCIAGHNIFRLYLWALA